MKEKISKPKTQNKARKNVESKSSFKEIVELNHDPKYTFDIKGFAHQSEAYCMSPPSPPKEAYPKITITSSTIAVEHRTVLGGRITYSTLVNVSNNTILKLRAGYQNVQPGVYYHQLGDAFIYSPGEVHSYIHYN